jgi:hypothetical protein
LVTTDVSRRPTCGEDDHTGRGDFDEWRVLNNTLHDGLKRTAGTAPERGSKCRPLRNANDYDTRGSIEHDDTVSTAG